jgi:hypothetical protein
MMEQIIIAIVVIVLLGFGIRKFWRVSSGRDAGGCTGCPGCRQAGHCPGSIGAERNNQVDRGRQEPPSGRSGR